MGLCLKVLHVITSLNDGGAQAVLYNLIKHDKLYKHEVISLCGKGKYSSLLMDLAVDVQHLNLPRGRVHFSGLLELVHLVKNSSPDVVQTWM